MGEACANCDEPLQGPFCHACGQRRLGPGDRRLGHLLQQFFGALTNLDSRFWRTLTALIVRPGRLSADYIAGRRARWMAPVTVFLLANLLYFLAPAFTDFELPFTEHADGPLRVRLAEEQRELTPEERLRIGDYGAQLHSRWTGPLVLERVERRDARARALEPAGRYTLGDYQRAYDQRRGEVSRLLIFLHVPVLALALWLTHPARRWYFAEHMVVALHLFAFMIVLVEVIALPGAYLTAALGHTGVPSGFKLGLGVILLIYTTRALQVVYQRPLWLALPSAAITLLCMGLFSVTLYRTIQFLVIFALT